jgi:hypothetical protein
MSRGTGSPTLVGVILRVGEEHAGVMRNPLATVVSDGE